MRFAHLPAARSDFVRERVTQADVRAMFQYPLACRHAVTRSTSCGEHYETRCATCDELLDED